MTHAVHSGFKLTAISLIISALLACSPSDQSQSESTLSSSNSSTDQPLNIPAETQKTSSQAEAAQAFAALLKQYFDENLEMNPVQATMIGDKRYNDRLPNFLGEAYRNSSQTFQQNWLDKIQSVNRDELTEADQLSYDIFIYQRKQALEGMQYPGYYLPVNQFFSIPNFFAQMGSGKSMQPFKTVLDYDNFLNRIDDAIVLFDQAIENMKSGVEQQYTNPRVLMERVLPQLKAHTPENLEESVFWMPVKNMPESFTESDKARLTEAYRNSIQNKVIPAYQRLHDYIEKDYIPACRESYAQSALPGGKDWYNFMIKTHTTTDLSADEIHQFGLDEVARIREKMKAVKQEVGFEGSLNEFFQHLKTDSSFYYEDEKDVIAGYEAIRDRVNAKLPDIFDVMPKADYEVRAVEAYRAKSAAAAMYMPPSPDGSRPGIFYANVHDLSIQPKYGMETLSLHEASPGHHFQIAIQQEIGTLPAFRRFGGFTAYMEGWALYAESLGPELGLFTDPYQYFGHLDAEMLRAMRLVVDTGLHAFDWSREQAIQYMLDNSSMGETDVTSEVERYIAIPGQALAYKIGQHTIRNLRTEAEETLGDHFDIKAFHQAILSSGAVPLDVLKARIQKWIEQQTPSKEA